MLRGKRKSLASDPQAQMVAIAQAYGGRLPFKPQYRRYPWVAWKEEGTYHIVKLIKGNIYHKILEKEPTCIICRDAKGACNHLAKRYYRMVMPLDLEAAKAIPVPVPTLADAQKGIMCWPTQQTLGNTRIWHYTIVSPNGIKSSTTNGQPSPQKDDLRPFMILANSGHCMELLHKAFHLDINWFNLQESYKKVIQVPKIKAIKGQEDNGKVAGV